ncbi:UDP-N-acetylmuramoyl-L-alanine--D-glutamate ligase [Arhodomonas sp. AD133]|uniref:UDP-N-acetylmuramoyl-L-alanine--D-glutamate ligase n=1 Tax=Arhodomonas sp. AD133 TaxID=3415009 RepID=UPI003EB7CC9C
MGPDRRAYTAIVGLGESGYACARHLVDRGQSVAVTDSREAPPRAAALTASAPGVAQHLGAIDGALLAGAAEVVLSPGVDPRHPAIEAACTAGVPVIGEIELFARAVDAPVVAITGSNGKSTVTTLVGEMAQAAGVEAAVGGNLGPAAVSLLARKPRAQLYVLELSSFQLETVSTLAPAASVVLNVSADHLDRYPDLAGYAAAKAKVYDRSAVAVVNRDDPAVAAMARASERVIGFTLAAPNSGEWGVRDGAFVRGGERLCDLNTWRMPGTHNRANALAALALGDAVGLPWSAMIAALGAFRGLPHRMELVGEVAGRWFYNDSKGTNVGAAEAAVAGLAAPVVLIAGGQAKGQDFAPLAAALAGRARGVVLLGEDAHAIAAALTGVCPLEQVPDMATAVRAAFAMSRSGDAVLLSPACASFDMFPGYAARGDAFRECVEGLGHD